MTLLILLHPSIKLADPSRTTSSTTGKTGNPRRLHGGDAFSSLLHFAGRLSSQSKSNRVNMTMAEGEQVQRIPSRNDGTWDDRRSLKTALIRHPNRFHLGVGSHYTVTRGRSRDRAHPENKTDRTAWLTTPMASELQTPHYYKRVQIEMKLN
jgi:hypothetical protein